MFHARIIAAFCKSGTRQAAAPSLSVGYSLASLTLTATSTASTSPSSQFVKCGQVQNKGKYLHRRSSPFLPSFLPSSLLSPTHQPPPTPTDHLDGQASCCVCLCGLSGSIRYAGGSMGENMSLSFLCKMYTHETSSLVEWEIRIS